MNVAMNYSDSADFRRQSVGWIEGYKEPERIKFRDKSRRLRSCNEELETKQFLGIQHKVQSYSSANGRPLLTDKIVKHFYY